MRDIRWLRATFALLGSVGCEPAQRSSVETFTTYDSAGITIAVNPATLPASIEHWSIAPDTLQMDIGTGRLLQTAYRRTDLIEDLHTGAWFSDGAKLWVFLPIALVVTSMWITGMYMAIIHYRAVRRRKAAVPSHR